MGPGTGGIIFLLSVGGRARESEPFFYGGGIKGALVPPGALKAYTR
jgi:hypothetical protein